VISVDEGIIKELEELRAKKKQFTLGEEDKSHFTERIIKIGLIEYKKKQDFFDRLDLHNVDLSKINF